ncbi:MAG: hypothetical protein IPP10_15115 [Candidatus Competibacteraceae bacterium]|nr:hypothetical protein [Candidatus Competibacteraceae bacterium]
MSTQTWNSELIKFREMGQLNQLVWLSQLLYLISMLARGTYEAGTDAVLDPIKLRQFNELIHRIASFTKKVAKASDQGIPDVDFFELLQKGLSSLKISDNEILKRLPD